MSKGHLMNNFEKWKQQITVNKLAALLSKSVSRCEFCKIKYLCTDIDKNIEACERAYIKWLNTEIK